MPRRKNFRMTQKEADLVVGSMVEWEQRIGSEYFGCDPCPVCHGGKYAHPGTPVLCMTADHQRCPVYRYTGKASCRGTNLYRMDTSRAIRIVSFAMKMLDDAGYRIGWTRVK